MRAFSVFLAFIAPLFLAALPAASQPDNETCMSCHASKEMGGNFVDLEAYRKSIHGKNLCVSCHRDAVEIPHPPKLRSVACNRCHRLETQIYLNSDHGRAVARGRLEAASCKDCHGHSHTLLNSRHPDSPVNRRRISATCASCHNDPVRMAKAHLAERQPLATYNHSIHGEAFARGRVNAAVCSDCHGSHDLHGSFNPSSRIFRTNIPRTCGRCHQNVEAVYEESIHGRAMRAGIKEAPVCTDCHGEHLIRPVRDPESTVAPGAISRTCSGCHESQRLSIKFGLPVDRLRTYLETYHGLAYQRGDLRVANCSSCHGWHDILPSTDPRSSIHPSNLANTCGRCHPGAGSQLTKGYVHGAPTGKHWIMAVVRKFYLILIPLVVGFMLLHNGLDLLSKMIRGAAAAPRGAHAAALRLTVNERWQHGILALTFILLALSGFALKFPEAAWARFLMPVSEEARRSLHRWAALFFCLLGAYHLLYMAGTRRGRRLLAEFAPSRNDGLSLARHFAYTLGFRTTPPEPETGFYTYGEKIEYWSLLWGSAVMVITGGLLVFTNFTLRHAPLWILDLATFVHYYEAILACLAIVIWHFYGVIFDPLVYPMNFAWLTGRAGRGAEPESPPDGAPHEENRP